MRRFYQRMKRLLSKQIETYYSVFLRKKTRNTILCFLFIIIMTELLPFGTKNLLETLDIEVLLREISAKETREYILGLWQIQTSISILSFAIVSIYIERIDKHIFGVRLIDLTKDTVGLFDFNSLIVFSLLQVLTNYINFLYQWFNSAVSILFLSCVTILYFATKSLSLTVNNNLERQVEQNYLNTQRLNIERENING